MKATRVIATNEGHNNWLLTAMVNDIPYQKRFDHAPTHEEANIATSEFEDNYKGLNESNNKPVKTITHHMER